MITRKLCEYEGCSIRPHFDIEGGKGRYCFKHKKNNMINVTSKRCEYTSCNIISPSFNIKGGKGRFCKDHKTADMIDVRHRRCENSDCEVMPAFNIIGKKARFCKEHKMTNMINVIGKRCEAEGCYLEPSFNITGGKARFCKKHKLTDMIDVNNKRCISEGCNKLNPSFGIRGSIDYFCKKHKTEEMIDLKNKRCEANGCNKISPVFDIKGGKGRFCKQHKTPEMVDIKSSKCEIEGCSIRPNFDIKNGKGRFCKHHKTIHMVDVRHSVCIIDGCSTRAVFNIKGNKGRYCIKHKTAEMYDVTAKYCNQDSCETRATYGIPGNPVSRCSKHRAAGMILKPTAKCSDCNEPALWGINWIPRHCELHKVSDDENLVERPCISCGLPYILDKENKCENCNPESWTTARLAKQNALMDYLDTRGLKGLSTDKIVDGGICGKERPDRIYDLGDKILILECDEHQHRERACLCEQTRMVNIGQSFGGLPVYFLRWNPVPYTPAGRKKPEDIRKRYKLVGDFIADISAGKMTLPTAFISALYMYYDDWSSLAEEEWKVLVPYEKNEVIVA